MKPESVAPSVAAVESTAPRSKAVTARQRRGSSGRERVSAVATGALGGPESVDRANGEDQGLDVGLGAHNERHAFEGDAHSTSSELASAIVPHLSTVDPAGPLQEIPPRTCTGCRQLIVPVKRGRMLRCPLCNVFQPGKASPERSPNKLQQQLAARVAELEVMRGKPFDTAMRSLAVTLARLEMVEESLAGNTSRGATLDLARVASAKPDLLKALGLLSDKPEAANAASRVVFYLPSNGRDQGRHVPILSLTDDELADHAQNVANQIREKANADKTTKPQPLITPSPTGRPLPASSPKPAVRPSPPAPRSMPDDEPPRAAGADSSHETPKQTAERVLREMSDQARRAAEAAAAEARKVFPASHPPQRFFMR